MLVKVEVEGMGVGKNGLNFGGDGGLSCGEGSEQCECKKAHGLQTVAPQEFFGKESLTIQKRAPDRHLLLARRKAESLHGDQGGHSFDSIPEILQADVFVRA